MKPSPPMPSPVIAQIAALPDLLWPDLKLLWERLFGAPPTVQHRRFLERRIAYRLQENELRKTDPALLVRNRRRIDALVETGTLPPRVRNPAPMPGTVLIREYDGAEHRVLVVGEHDFEYAGQRYPSLSMIARAITGTRWSGPAFFGLRERPKQRDKKR